MGGIIIREEKGNEHTQASPVNKGEITDLEFLSNELLVSAGSDGQLILWDLATQQIFKTHSNITKVLFLPAKNPYGIIYGTTNDGLYLLKTSEMKYLK